MYILLSYLFFLVFRFASTTIFSVFSSSRTSLPFNLLCCLLNHSCNSFFLLLSVSSSFFPFSVFFFCSFLISSSLRKKQKSHENPKEKKKKTNKKCYCFSFANLRIRSLTRTLQCTTIQWQHKPHGPPSNEGGKGRTENLVSTIRGV